jgi:hypothetical protein
VVFSLVVMAIPLGMMSMPEPAAPLPHLARMPPLQATVLHGPTPPVLHSGGIVDITAWPCAEPCIARTAALAALAHGDTPPPLVSILTTPPDDHPALDAARAVEGWAVLEVSESAALHAAWFAARGDRALPTGGILVVDENGSIRAVVPASAAGIEVAMDAWEDLQSAPPG